MGGLFSISQPKYSIDVMGRSYRVTRDDADNGFRAGEVVKPVAYFVAHGISSLTVHCMYLHTLDGRSLPVAVFDGERQDAFYFVAGHEGGPGLPTYDSTAGAYPYSAEAAARPYPLQLRHTDRLELVA